MSILYLPLVKVNILFTRMRGIYSNQKIVDKLLEILQHPTKVLLARDLGVSKQSLSQFAKQQGVDINNKIITRLISELKK